MFIFECKKIIKNRKILFLFFIILLLNPLVTIYGEGETRSPLTDAGYLLEENYTAHLDDILEENKRQQSLYKMFENETFSERNLLEGYSAYEKLHDIKLPGYSMPEICMGINSVFQRIVLYMFTTCVSIYSIFVELNGNMNRILLTTRDGRKKLIITKVMSVAGLSFLLGTFLLMQNYLIGVSYYGFHSLNNPVQVLPGYIDSPLVMNVGELIFLYLLIMLLEITLISFAIAMITLLIKEITITVLLTVFFYLVSWLLYNKISSWSIYSVIKYSSVFTGIYITDFFQTWSTMNLFERPIVVWQYYILANIICITIVSVISIYLWRECIEQRGAITVYHFKERRRVKVFSKLSLLLFEMKKLVFHQNIIYLLVAMCVVQIFSYSAKQYYSDEEEFYYQEYSKQLTGPVNMENYALISRWLEEIIHDSEECDSLLKQKENNEISESYFSYVIETVQNNKTKKAALERVRDQYMSLLNLHNKDGQVEYTVVTPFKLWFEDWIENVLDDMKLLFSTVFISVIAFVYDRNTRMDVLLRTRVNGYKKILRCRRICLNFLSFTLGIIDIVPRIIWICHRFKIESFNISSLSIACLPLKSSWMTVWQSILVYELLRLFIIMVIVNGICFIGNHASLYPSKFKC